MMIPAKIQFKCSPIELQMFKGTLHEMIKSEDVDNLHLLLLRKFYLFVSVKVTTNEFLPRVRTLNIPTEMVLAFCNYFNFAKLDAEPYTENFINRFILQVHPKLV